MAYDLESETAEVVFEIHRIIGHKAIGQDALGKQFDVAKAALLRAYQAGMEQGIMDGEELHDGDYGDGYTAGWESAKDDQR